MTDQLETHDQAKTPDRTNNGDDLRSLGELVWLVAHSEVHTGITLDELESIFLHPMHIGQMRRWYRGDAMVGLATWAWLDEEAEAEYLATGQVAPGKWQSGDRLWFVDVIAPFGDVKEITRELRQVIPQGHTAQSARWNEDKSLRKIGKFAA